MVERDTIEIELLPEQRELILKYGYPFPDERKQLQRHASSSDIEVLTINPFYLEKMIGDLSYSINKRTKGSVQSDLLDLCDRLEYAEKYGDGQLDAW